LLSEEELLNKIREIASNAWIEKKTKAIFTSWEDANKFMEYLQSKKIGFGFPHWEEIRINGYLYCRWTIEIGDIDKEVSNY
jgi:hypothetical protein